MKKFIIAIVAIICGAACGAATDAELFIGNVKGVTAQDISLCQDSYVNGGRYYHRIYNATLECSYNHISVDFDHEE